MEKRFLIKVTATATDDNPNFKGDVNVFFYGKGSELLDIKTSREYDRKRMTSYDILKFGYSRKCDASRAFVFKNLNCGFEKWTSTAEIVEYNVYTKRGIHAVCVENQPSIETLRYMAHGVTE